jgi:hypothetical protein
MDTRELSFVIPTYRLRDVSETKPVAELPENYARGELLVDSAMDLETNATKGLALENSLTVERGRVSDTAVVKIAQTFRSGTFRSGTNDIDAIDFVDMFLADESQTDPDALNDLYVLVNFRPVVTNWNWRMDCGVAGYDNTFGLPPFFPTRLRFEDYIYRLWVRQDGVVAAHVDAAQHHTRSNYMRNPPAAEIFNEEVSNLIKRKIKGSVAKVTNSGSSSTTTARSPRRMRKRCSRRSSACTRARWTPCPTR